MLRPSGTAAVFLHERRACSSLLRRNKHGYEQRNEGKRGELTYAHRFCKRLLRRPCTGWRQRVLRGRCGGQVDRRCWVWVRRSAAARSAQEVSLLRQVNAVNHAAASTRDNLRAHPAVQVHEAESLR